MATAETFVALTPEDWEILQSIVRKHPDAHRELVAAQLTIRDIVIPTSYDLVNSDDEVVATYPCGAGLGL